MRFYISILSFGGRSGGDAEVVGEIPVLIEGWGRSHLLFFRGSIILFDYISTVETFEPTTPASFMASLWSLRTTQILIIIFAFVLCLIGGFICISSWNSYWYVPKTEKLVFSPNLCLKKGNSTTYSFFSFITIKFLLLPFRFFSTFGVIEFYNFIIFLQILSLLLIH